MLSMSTSQRSASSSSLSAATASPPAPMVSNVRSRSVFHWNRLAFWIIARAYLMTFAFSGDMPDASSFCVVTRSMPRRKMTTKALRLYL